MRTLILVDGGRLYPYAHIHYESAAEKFCGSVDRLRQAIGGETAVAAFFDRGGKKAREQIDETYKGTRLDSGMDMRAKSDEARQLLFDKGALCYLCKEYEADDAISAFAAKFAPTAPGGSDGGITRVLIYADDKDFRQCLRTGCVSMVSFVNRGLKYFTEVELRRQYKVSPQLWPLWQAICGDSVDNIKGWQYVGPTTAAILLQGISTPHDFVKRWEKDKFGSSLAKRQRESGDAFFANLDKLLSLTTLMVDLPGFEWVKVAEALDWKNEA